MKILVSGKKIGYLGECQICGLAAIFDPTEINYDKNEGVTAICPNCKLPMTGFRVVPMSDSPSQENALMSVGDLKKVPDMQKDRLDKLREL